MSDTNFDLIDDTRRTITISLSEYRSLVTAAAECSSERSARWALDTANKALKAERTELKAEIIKLREAQAKSFVWCMPGNGGS